MDFNLDNLELNLEEDLALDEIFELSSVEDNEVINQPHFKVSTKDFLTMVKKAKTIISSASRDLISKAVCMHVEDNQLYINVTDFDVYMELKTPIINTGNIIDRDIVCPVDTLLQLAKALPSTTTILVEDDKVKIRLIGGSIDIETLDVSRDKFLLKDDLQSDKNIDAQSMFSILNAFTSIVQASVNPMEKRIIFDENGARALYMFTMVGSEGDYPKFDVKVKDLSVLKVLLANTKGKLKTFRTSDEKASSRFIIEGTDFKYAFLVGEVNINRIMKDSYNNTNFSQGAYIEFSNLSKLVELSGSLNYASGKVELVFTDSNVLEVKVPTKGGDNTFKLDATPNGNIKINEAVTIPSKMLLTVLKTFQKDTVLSLYVDEDIVILSNSNFKGIILLDA